ncbi:EAL domain-containing protein [Luteimonas sp. RD2P54]|uniref:EAL domain-containing protein n=1 Tax=Luteimonas endophytica TaxID=3042023 RepID=A0ABT6JDJ5_9GAMM|nr:EAL domain-containing response regulator [Luteimonas endophytica]MDH5824890.1 EAL domain-containing protein [Luteimonas endophytica]
MGKADDPRRAEFPPAQYWRRWGADAPAPVLPLEDGAGLPEEALLLPAAARPPAAAAGEPPYRVLIVEDDRSQALFAQSVLHGAGMEAQAVSDAAQVMAALEAFSPDLVLMDLHMPAMDGAELTDMIRGHATHAHLPIVFLTGDPDPERQFEVLEIGADDFLSKPVRPRHLVAAVENRIKRARQLRVQRRTEPAPPSGGLQTRNAMLQRLAAAVPGDDEGGGGGALFMLEIDGVPALRDRIGYAALESVLTEAGRQVAALADGHHAARLNDNTFLIHAAQAPEDMLGWARRLRDGLGRHGFEVAGEPLRLRVRVGCTALGHGFADAGSAMSAAEQALRASRADPIGIAAYQPPASEEIAASSGLADMIVEALAGNRLELAYQPIVAVAGGDEAQYQTLLRLRDAEGELHTAGQILPAAESAGLLHEIDRQVLELALALLARQQARGAPVRLFVSQSPRSLARDGHAAWLLAELETQRVDGSSLVLDVRQDDALIHAVSLQEFCSDMVPAGVQLCLSQYRPGEDINPLIAQLPLSFVRLAADFSSRLGESAVRDEMRDAIERAHRLGMQVIGQQVEDPQAAATLWMSGIDYIQGNLVQQVAGDLDFDFHHSVL